MKDNVQGDFVALSLDRPWTYIAALSPVLSLASSPAAPEQTPWMELLVTK